MEKSIVKSGDTISGYSEEQKALIKSVIAKDATDQELQFFLYTAKRTGLDPLTRQIYFVKRNVRDGQGWKSQMTVQTSIDGYRAIAERTGELAGIDDVVYDDESKANPSKATVTVYRLVKGQRVGFTASARWNEYRQVRSVNGKEVLSGMWMKMPFLMLGKCAEALALRKAFPNDLSGIYTSDEMSQADSNVPSVTSVPDEEKEIVYDSLAVDEEGSERGGEIPRDTEEVPFESKPKPSKEDQAKRCFECNSEIDLEVADYSKRFFGVLLCRDHQKLEKYKKLNKNGGK